MKMSRGRILSSRAEAIVINRVFANECHVNAIKKQQRINKTGRDSAKASDDSGIIVK